MSSKKPISPGSKENEPGPQEINQLVALFKQGRYADVEILARKMTERFPSHGFGWKAMGTSLVKQGRPAEALAALQQAAALSQGDAQLHNNLGNTLVELNMLPEAETSYRQATMFNPNFAEAHHNLGNTLLKLDRLPEAETSHRRALEINPNFAEAHNNLGSVLLKLGRLPEAEACYRRALEINPNFASAHFNMGSVLLERGLQKESVHCYQQAFAKRVGWHHDGDQNLSSGLIDAYIELTNKCNFHCDFCPSDSQQRTKGFMDMGLVKKIYDELAEKNLVERASLHLMGEPTLHPRLEEILSYASSKNIRTELVTNGSTLNAKTIPKILDSLYGLLVVSLQTPTPETFKHRGDTGLNWGRYIKNIRLLVREYLKRIASKRTCRSTLELRVMITKDSKLPVNIIESPGDINNIKHEWRNFVAGIETELGLVPFNRKEPSSEIMTTQAEMRYPLQQGLSLLFWKGFTFANSMLSSAYTLEYNEAATFCRHPFIEVAILSNGDVTLCCLDYDGKLAVGNINDNTIEAILNGKPTMDLRAAMLGLHPLPPYCQQCQAKAVLPLG